MEESSKETFVKDVWILKLVPLELLLLRPLDKSVNDKHWLLGLLRRLNILTEREPGPEQWIDERMLRMLKLRRQGWMERDKDRVWIGDRRRQGHGQQQEVCGEHFLNYLC